MKIVVLDGYTLNPGDLSWEALKKLGEVEIYDRTPSSKIIDRGQGAQILLTNKTPLDASTIRELPDLQYIGVLATGFDIVDVDAAKARNIPVTNASGYATPSVAQHTLGLLLELTNRVADHDEAVRKGAWRQDFSLAKFPLTELADKTMGIVGFGRIGQAVADLAMGLGMKVKAHHKHPERDAKEGVEFVQIPELFESSDVVSLHCPLTNDNKQFVNRDLLQTMKLSAFLLNTSRGALINEEALKQALNHDWIAGAGLDVLSKEPPQEANPMFEAKNCIITPHNAWATKESRQRLMDIVVDNILSFMDGSSKNVVNL